MKETIFQQSRLFMINNKQILKDQGVQKEDLETLLVPKDNFSDLDDIKKDYFERIDDERKKALRFFKMKHYELSMNHLKEVI
mmetsp:Transcript_3088/g.2965  ORF Transcript_3088/g.2965 Transcript_3088/m.2965 type:complete len:82 (+) Transcript_3088:753-998(+)